MQWEIQSCNTAYIEQDISCTRGSILASSNRDEMGWNCFFFSYFNRLIITSSKLPYSFMYCVKSSSVCLFIIGLQLHSGVTDDIVYCDDDGGVK